jgi:hypothetical protein
MEKITIWVFAGWPRISPVRTSLEAAKGFCGDVLGLQPVMDHGWIITLADPERPGAQISLMTHDATAPYPRCLVHVDDVDACHPAAAQAGAGIVCPLTVEPWGVHPFSPATLTDT